MNNDIVYLKHLINTAVDFEQKRIVNLEQLLEVVRKLQNFPMTMAVLNSSRIARVINDVRHFHDVSVDHKKLMKDLIRSWNKQLIPDSESKKSSEENNNRQNMTTVDSSKESFPTKKSVSTNDLQTITNGLHSNKRKYDSTNSTDIKHVPYKMQKIEKFKYANSPVVSETDSCPLPDKYRSIKTEENHSHFPDMSNVFKDNKSINNNNLRLNKNHQDQSPLTTTRDKKSQKRREPVTNGVTASKLPKVKSTRELLEGMGDFVGIDTKNKILGNEITREDDTPKSCLPESVRPRNKLTKSLKQSSQPLHTNNNNILNNTTNIDPLLIQQKPPRLSTSPPQQSPSQIDKNEPSSILPQQIKQQEIEIKKLSPLKETPTSTNNHVTVSETKPKKRRITSSKPPTVDKDSKYQKTEQLLQEQHSSDSTSTEPSKDTPTEQSLLLPKTCDTSSNDLLKFKIKAPKKHKDSTKKKKHKHSHVDPPITNRMNDIPLLKDISDVNYNPEEFMYDVKPKPDDDIDDETRISLANKLVHTDWVNHNCTEHPTTKDLIPHNQSYSVGDLLILPWTSNMFQNQSFFPESTVKDDGSKTDIVESDPYLNYMLNNMGSGC